MIRNIGLMTVLFFTVGCAQSSNDPSSDVSTSATSVAFNPSGAPTIEFTVPDMMCPEGCGEKVKEILAKQPGTKDVLVEFEAKTVKVAIDKDKFDANKAVAALHDHQFGQAALKDVDAAGAAAILPPEKSPVAN